MNRISNLPDIHPPAYHAFVLGQVHTGYLV